MFRVIANTENEFVFSKFGKLIKSFVHILQKKICICPLIEKKSGSFQTLRYVGLRLMLDDKLMLSIPSTLFLNKQFEILYNCNRHTANVYVPFYKGKIF